MADHDAVELLQPVLVGKDLLPQLLPVQLPLRVKGAGEGEADLIPQGGAVLQHLMVQPVAVHHLSPQGLDGPQGAGLARAGAAGEAQHHLLAVRLHHVEAGGLFQPVADGQPQPPVVRALGVDLRHVAGVKGPQGVKHPLGLGQLVPRGAQGVDLLSAEQIRELVKADDTGGGSHPPQDLLGGLLRRAGDDGDRRLGGIVAVFHAGGLGLLPLRQSAVDGLVHIDLADEPLQVLHGQPAGPQQPGRVAGQVQDGGLHPHRAGAAVHHAVDAAVHVLQHVLGRGAAGPAGQVGAGRRDGDARLPDDGQGHRVVGAAHRHRVQPGGGLIGDDGPPLQDHGQRAGPELPRQHIGQGRHVGTVPGQPLGAGDMDDEGIVLGPALGLEDPLHRGAVQGVGPQAVHRLRGDAHQAAVPQDLGRCGDLVLDLLLLALGVPQVKISCLHISSPLSLFAGVSSGGISLVRARLPGRLHAVSPLFSFSAWSAVTSASMSSSRSPSRIASILYSVRPIRWSVTRPWGKL